MTKDKFYDFIVEPTITRIRQTFENKNQQYGSDDDVFRSIKKIAASKDVPPVIAADWLLSKHLNSYDDLIKGVIEPDEFTVNEKIDDLIIYLLLQKGLLLETKFEHLPF
jgi:ABC-type lipoprotein release transport system permease subunit